MQCISSQAFTNLTTYIYSCTVRLANHYNGLQGSIDWYCMQNHVAAYNQNNLLKDAQHRFMLNRSTLTNKLCTQENFSSIADATQGVNIVFQDLSKAFDVVNHRLVLANLEVFYISPAIQRWVTSFSENQSMTVRTKMVFLSETPICKGVSQGSVPGHVLFLIYINDLPASITLRRYFRNLVTLWRISGKNSSGPIFRE